MISLMILKKIFIKRKNKIFTAATYAIYVKIKEIK